MILFVAKLNPSTTTKDLQNLFSHYGLVKTVKIIFDHVTGKSRCYGFVEMPNNFEAHEALNEINNASFQESIILVKESQPADYRLFPPTPGSRNREGRIRSSGNADIREKPRNPFSVVKPRGEDDLFRNFGYRGSGNRSLR